MDKKILLIIGTLSLAVVAAATLSSYGSITGYATVDKAISLDIMGSSNDEIYDLGSVYQGDTEYSPEIKLVNKANKSIEVNVLVSILPGSSGNENDVAVSLANEFLNATLANPIQVPVSDLRFRVKHEFRDDANLGNYTFKVEVLPA